MPTALDRSDCHTHVEGGGCELPRPGRTCEDVVSGGGHTGLPVDTGQLREHHLSGGGSGCGCTQVAAGSGAWLVLALLLGLLRRPWVGAVLALLWIPRAEAIDVTALDPLDGAPVPGLVDPLLGPDWTPRLSLSATAATNPVWMRSGPASVEIVTLLDSYEAGLSQQLDDWMVVGLALSVHHVALEGGTSGTRLGDPVGFLRIPLRQRGLATDAFELRLQKPPSSIREPGEPIDPALPWTSTASASLGWVGSRTLPRSCGAAPTEAGYACPWWIGARVAARLQPARTLPGLTWTSRWEAGAGIRRNLGIFGLGGSLSGSAPLKLFRDPTAGWPLEWLGVGSVRMGPSIVLTAGGGTGLSRGLGTPEARAVATLTWLGRFGDQDGDGYLDPRDLCPRQAEDRDGFRDGDGCPEPDNDRDGIVDADDRCPVEPETVNGWEDADGCPDELADWIVEVDAPEPIEQVWVAVDGEGAWEVATRLRFGLPPGEHVLAVEAPGHVPVRMGVRLGEGANHTEVQLQQIVMSAATISLVSADTGAPVAGGIAVDGTEYEIPAGGATLPIRVGRHPYEARAPGHLPETGRIAVMRSAPTPIEIRLDRIPALSAPQVVLFELGSAELRQELELIDTLAGWLVDHPEIRRLRVEGHADEVGDSAYNLALSERRAQAVVDALVARGVDRARLDPIGSGESRAWLSLHGLPPEVDSRIAGEALREVAFQVLVWDDPPEAL